MITKSFSTSRIFGQVAISAGFKGSGVTRFIDYPDYWLLVNHQKSSYSTRFYINVAILYKELLTCNFSEDDIKTIYKNNATIWPHVTFRLESCPALSPSLKEDMDKFVEEQDEDGLTATLKHGLTALLNFVEHNHGRQNIRKLNDERKLTATLTKEV